MRIPLKGVSLCEILGRKTLIHEIRELAVTPMIRRSPVTAYSRSYGIIVCSLFWIIPIVEDGDV